MLPQCCLRTSIEYYKHSYLDSCIAFVCLPSHTLILLFLVLVFSSISSSSDPLETFLAGVVVEEGKVVVVNVNIFVLSPQASLGGEGGSLSGIAESSSSSVGGSFIIVIEASLGVRVLRVVVVGVGFRGSCLRVRDGRRVHPDNAPPPSRSSIALRSQALRASGSYTPPRPRQPQARRILTNRHSTAEQNKHTKLSRT